MNLGNSKGKPDAGHPNYLALEMERVLTTSTDLNGAEIDISVGSTGLE